MRRVVQLCAAALASAPAAVAKPQQEVLVAVRGGGKLGLSTKGRSAFRVRFLWPGSLDAQPLESPMVGPDEADATFEEAADGIGIITGFGSLEVSKGSLTVRSPGKNVITVSERIDAGDRRIRFSSRKASSLYGRGASPVDCNTLTANSSYGLTCNRATYAPYYWSTDGYSALGVTQSLDEVTGNLLVKYTTEGASGAARELDPVGDSRTIAWHFESAQSFELYIMPASSMKDGTKAYYELIGHPRVPPRYAFGFMASRWGWENRAYIEDAMHKFRSGNFPIDAIISDFEWFTPKNDYDLTPEGTAGYQDFGFNNVTFDQPVKQLREYRKNHFRVGGIRKPRLGNTALLQMAQAKKWTLPQGTPSAAYPPDWPQAYAKDRVLNYSLAEVRDWYAKQLEPLIDDGMSFWWNDEGESTFFTFYWWNMAQLQALRARDKYRRFYSINRAFSPGLARLGATVWTGDIGATYEDLRGTPGMMLNWILAGAPYVGCDIGGFSSATGPTGQMLTRWMQVGVFMPTMRVHSVISNTPHFPWLFGDAAAVAIRDALNLRYRLVLYHYSLAHRLFSSGDLWVKPLIYEFPEDEQVVDTTESWLDGDILVAPVLNDGFSQTVYLPQGTWYPFAATSATCNSSSPSFRPVLKGPTAVQRDVSLNEIPAYVRAGAVVPLAHVVQSTAQLPGGPLEVQIYTGADGSFDLVEDDGETTRYEMGHSRVVKFRWHDATKRLTWDVGGYMFGMNPNSFTHVFATIVDEHGSAKSSTWPIGVAGSIDFKQLPETLFSI